MAKTASLVLTLIALWLSPETKSRSLDSDSRVIAEEISTEP